MDVIEKLKGAPKDVVEFVRSQNPREVEDFINEYAKDRTIRDEQVGNRRDKAKKDGTLIKVNKIPIQFQKKIVVTASAYLFGGGVDITSPEPNEDYNLFRDWWKRLRMDGKVLKACMLTKSLTHSGLLFRITEDSVGDTTLKAMVLDPQAGNLYPIFDMFGDMVAFGWEVKAKDEEDNEIVYLYVYDQTTVTVFVEDNNGVSMESKKPHGFDRIPVVYVSQDYPEWEDVKELIDRFEVTFSRFADANDYFSSPFFKATGKVDNVPEKDETGSVYMLDIVTTQNGQVITSDLDVISWDRAPEAVKLEFETLKTLIYNLSSTPDLSFDNMKGIGNIAGVALELMFLDSKIKSKFDEIIWKEAMHRIINVMKSGLSALSEISEAELEIQYGVAFNSIMPDDLQSKVDLLLSATGQKAIMSVETALTKNPMIDDPENEKILLDNEQNSDLGDTFSIPGITPTA